MRKVDYSEYDDLFSPKRKTDPKKKAAKEAATTQPPVKK